MPQQVACCTSPSGRPAMSCVSTGRAGQGALRRALSVVYRHAFAVLRQFTPPLTLSPKPAIISSEHPFQSTPERTPPWTPRPTGRPSSTRSAGQVKHLYPSPPSTGSSPRKHQFWWGYRRCPQGSSAYIPVASSTRWATGFPGPVT